MVEQVYDTFSKNTSYKLHAAPGCSWLLLIEAKISSNHNIIGKLNIE